MVYDELVIEVSLDVPYGPGGGDDVCGRDVLGQFQEFVHLVVSHQLEFDGVPNLPHPSEVFRLFILLSGHVENEGPVNPVHVDLEGLQGEGPHIGVAHHLVE